MDGKLVVNEQIAFFRRSTGMICVKRRQRGKLAGRPHEANPGKPIFQHPH
jgi:hypothetical protein